MLPAIALLASLAASANSSEPADAFGREIERFASDLGAFAERISDGLPPELPPGYGEGFDDFEHLPGARPPYAINVRFDGAPARFEDLRAALRDEHGIRLPPGGRIRRHNPGTPEELWEFPEGTRLLHRFTWADDSATLFEFRLIERRPDGRWAFGTYLQAADGNLRLLQRQEAADMTRRLGEREVRVELTRLPPESCRACHFHRGHQRYPSPEKAGPCAFGPSNPALRGAWAERFKAKHGYDPFEN